MPLPPLVEDRFREIGVDPDDAIDAALQVPISVPCWQADDVTGLERRKSSSGGGILATGAHPGRARTGDEMREDLAKVLSLVPGIHRLNLHAMYAEPESPVERDELEAAHFARWIHWAKETGIGLDFNPTYFAHPKADAGFTLSSPDDKVREFWIRHGISSRRIAGAFAKLLGGDCLNNHWIPDGAKDARVDRWGPRERLAQSLDQILETPIEGCVDSVESKLFGLGSEDYVVGSFEFYSGYAQRRGIRLCLDMGHFHPTETIADKLSALLPFHKGLVLHVSRPMRWDSDHVPVLNDDLQAVFRELVRGKALDRARVALDFFDASLNRIAAYVIGIRATRQAVLRALLEPVDALQRLERDGKQGRKLALLEEAKALPWGEVWRELCRRAGVPEDLVWVDEAERYERDVLRKRK
jgi:L-rhamnose isomerase